MKHIYTLLMLLAAGMLKAYAQTDSLNRFNVYKSLLQETSTPALVADNGKHIVHIDTRLGVNTTESQTLHTDYAQISYSTQWRKHGFGAYYNTSISDLHTIKTGGIQYGFGFSFNKNNKLLANTKIVAATGISITQEHTSYNNLRYYDQIDNQYGFITTTNETPITNNIVYPTFNLGLLIRSSRLFANMTLHDLNQPQNGMYSSTGSQKEIRFALNSGLKFIDLDQLSGWVLIDYDYEELDHLGIAVAYRNLYMLSGKLNKYSSGTIRLSYFKPRIRAFLQYTSNKNPYTGYFEYGTLSMGLATGITKQ